MKNIKKWILWLGIILPNFIAIFIALLGFFNSKYQGLMIYFWVLMLFNSCFYYFFKQN